MKLKSTPSKIFSKSGFTKALQKGAGEDGYLLISPSQAVSKAELESPDWEQNSP